MSWQDRLIPATYTSPSGRSMQYQYTDISQSFDARGTAFNFIDTDGTYVQSTGRSGRRLPQIVYLSGDNYDLLAAQFESMLMESGVGKLELPFYGVIDVVPLGTITRRDDLVTAGNQAAIQVEFFETIGVLFLDGQEDIQSRINNTLTAFNAAIANEFSNAVTEDTAIEQVSLRNQYRKFLKDAEQVLRPIAETVETVQQEFDEIIIDINSGIEVFIADPLSIAFQTALLIEAPARAASLIQDKLQAYRDLGISIITGDGANVRGNNDLHTRELYASSYTAAAASSTVNTRFALRKDAVFAADSVLTQFEELAVWRDEQYDSLEEIDPGESYQQLQQLVALTAGYLVELSFTLKTERRFILTRNRTVIDLLGELYGTIDDELDFFINSNNLVGTEILEIPEGREIVYYI